MEDGSYRYSFEYSTELAPPVAEIDHVLGEFEVGLELHADWVAEVLARWQEYGYVPGVELLRLLDLDPSPDGTDLLLLPRTAPLAWVEREFYTGESDDDPGAGSAPFPEESGQAPGEDDVSAMARASALIDSPALGVDSTQPLVKLAFMVPVAEVGAGVPVSISRPTGTLSYRSSGPGGADWGAPTLAECYGREQNSTGWMDMCVQAHRLANDNDVNNDYVAWRQFSSFQSRGATVLESAHNKIYPQGKETRADAWVEWSPKQSESGACRNVTVQVGAKGATIGTDVRACEEWEFSKATWPGGYRLIWHDFGSNQQRALDYWVAVKRSAAKVTAMNVFTCFSTWRSQCR